MEYNGKNCYFHDTSSLPSPSLKQKGKTLNKGDNQETMNIFASKSYDSDMDVDDTKSKGCMYKYSQESTMHGLRFITDFQANPVRRFIWFLLVLGCMAVLSYQMIDRIDYFYSWPVTVKVEINYNDSMVFPAVTICNQNSFRATAADKNGQFRVIQKLYGNSNRSEKISILQEENVENLSMEEMYLNLAHDKQDMIVGCHWGHRRCSHEDFVTILTDHGVCYTFSQVNFVASQGLEHGLRLTLNAEQYEYMPGRFQAAGIKILLHNSSETPLVHELGSAIPTGTHAFVGVKLLEVHNLESPYGKCGRRDLRYFENYTTEVCSLESDVKKIIHTCQCRPAFVPNTTDGPPPCSLSQNINCVEDFYQEDPVEETNTTSLPLSCPVPCDFILFEPEISYASVSNYAVDKLLGSELSTDLLDKLTLAKETKYRREKKHFDVTKHLIGDFSKKLDKVRRVLEGVLSDWQSSLYPRVLQRGIFHPMESMWRKKDELFRFQEFVLTKDFMMPWDIMKERYMNVLVNGFAEFALDVDEHIKLLTKRRDPEQRDLIHANLIITLNNRMEMANRTIENYRRITNAYSVGKSKHRHKFESLTKKHNTAATPKKLLSEALNRSKEVESLADKFIETLEIMRTSLLSYRDLADTAFSSVVKVVDEKKLSRITKKYIASCEKFVTSWHEVETEIIAWPLQQLIKKRSNFTDLWKNYEREFEQSKTNLELLKTSFSSVNYLFLRKLISTSNEAKEYVDNDSRKLVPLSRIISAESVRIAVDKLKSFFQTTIVHTKNIRSSKEKMKVLTDDIWTDIVNDTDARNYYIYTNNSHFLRPITEISYKTRYDYSQYFKVDDFQARVNGSDASLVDAFDELTKHLRTFKDTLKIDSEFFRDNFLNVDIFYRQLSYEEVQQQIAYNEFSLLCDIGGTMGLFIGASCLTIFEILDLILVVCFRRSDD